MQDSPSKEQNTDKFDKIKMYTDKFDKIKMWVI